MQAAHVYELALAGAVFTSAGWMLRWRRHPSGTPGPAARRAAAQRSRLASPKPSLTFQIAVQLAPANLLTSWRPERGVLLVSSPAAPRLGAKGVVQIQLAGSDTSAQLHGRAVAVHRADDDFRIEFTPDASGVRALRKLTDAAAAGQAPFPRRAPRFRMEAPAVVQVDGQEIYTTTTTISAGGCGLRWPGPPPPVGALLHVRLGAGLRELGHAFTVRWVERGIRHTCVGLQLFPDGPSAGRWQAYAGRMGSRQTGA